MKNYYEFIKESEDKLSRDDLVYSAITALMVFKPYYFNFLDEDKERYLLPDRSFWQGFVIELKTCDQVKLKKEHLFDIKNVSIENDWYKLKKCKQAADIIKEKFQDIQEIWVFTDRRMVIVSNDYKYTLKGKDKNHTVKKSDLEEFIGMDLSECENFTEYEKLFRRWLDLFKDYLKEDYKNIFIELLNELKSYKYEFSFKDFKKFKTSGLGYKLEEMPRLYYNNLNDYCKDLMNFESAFTNYNEFIDEWKASINKFLNKKILYPLLQKTQNYRRDQIFEFLKKHYDLEEENHYRFDSDMELKYVPSVNNLDNNDFHFEEKYTLNENKFLILECHFQDRVFKFLFCFKGENLIFDNIDLKYKVE